jgi:hypothetical protein
LLDEYILPGRSGFNFHQKDTKPALETIQVHDGSLSELEKDCKKLFGLEATRGD